MAFLVCSAAGGDWELAPWRPGTSRSWIVRGPGAPAAPAAP